MPNRLGFNAANHEPLATEDMAALGGNVYVIIAAAGHNWRGQLDILARPGNTLILRPYFVSDINTNPRITTRMLVEYLGDAASKTNHIVIGNEFNVETPDWHAALQRGQDSAAYYQRLNDWVLASVDELRTLLPRAVVHWPALSPGWGYAPLPDAGGKTGLELCEESIRACDEFDAHIYWPAGHALSPHYGRAYEAIWKIVRPWVRGIWFTEAGPTDVRAETSENLGNWIRALPPYVRGVAFFSWNWGHDHPEFRWMDAPIRWVVKHQGSGGVDVIPPWVVRPEVWYVTQRFGVRNPIYATGYHLGTDMAAGSATVGAAVIAPYRAVVAEEGYRADRGYWVVLTDLADASAQIGFYHLDRQTPWRVGDVVPKGALIGHVSANAGSIGTGAHLHVLYRYNGQEMDILQNCVPGNFPFVRSL